MSLNFSILEHIFYHKNELRHAQPEDEFRQDF